MLRPVIMIEDYLQYNTNTIQSTQSDMSFENFNYNTVRALAFTVVLKHVVKIDTAKVTTIEILQVKSKTSRKTAQLTVILLLTPDHG